MTELRQIDNKSLLQELRYRILENKIQEEEIFNSLERKEIISDCEIADLSKLTKEDWKKAYQTLENDKNYQEEVNLWEAIDEEDN